MIALLVAYDASGRIIATLEHMVATDAQGVTIGLVDFETWELQGGALTEIWQVDGAVGSGTWPEWIGSRAHDFRVDLDPSAGPGRHRIRALVHATSGFRRERAAIAAAVATRIANTPKGQPVDLRDLVGGPGKPLGVGPDGRTLPPVALGSPASLPVAAGEGGDA